ncbi:hypothetical protein L9F63_007084, partial [Diploptera punctata]
AKQARIVGGIPTEITRHPYQVSLERHGNYSCGGAIISPYYVVTAAHCVLREYSPPDVIDPNTLQVRVGSSYREHDGAVHQVLKIVLHPEFRQLVLFHNDIALIKVNHSFDYNDGVKPISIATLSPLPGSPAVMTGWGYTRVDKEHPRDYLPSQLQELQFVINQGFRCKLLSLIIDKNMLCVKSAQLFKGACNGDSGGPLVSKGKLVGIASFVVLGCARGFPDIYTNVVNYREWIESETGIA